MQPVPRHRLVLSLTLFVALTAVFAVTLLAVAGASASTPTSARAVADVPPTSPSTAAALARGVPTSNTWTGTPRPAGFDRYYYHWYKPSFSLRTGDVVTLAVDLSGTPPTGTLDSYTMFCFLPPVDDFGAQDTLGQDCGTSEFGSTPPGNFEGGGRHRFTMSYTYRQPGGFLVVRVRYSFQAPAGTYSFTVESVTTRVNIGITTLAQVGQSFAVQANARYGDNTTAGDGIRGVLQWRRAKKGQPGPAAFAALAQTQTSGGTLAFHASLPKADAASLAASGGSVVLRACINQPGSTASRCTPAFSARVVR